MGEGRVLQGLKGEGKPIHPRMGMRLEAKAGGGEKGRCIEDEKRKEGRGEPWLTMERKAMGKSLVRYF